MAALTFFTVTGDYDAIIADTDDAGIDPDLVPISAKVTFTPLLATGDVVLAATLTPRPSGLLLTPTPGILDTDGQLKTKKLDLGVRLVAETAILALAVNQHLHYEVEFDEVRFSSRQRGNDTNGSLPGFTFQAPTSDTTVDLITVTRT